MKNLLLAVVFMFFGISQMHAQKFSQPTNKFMKETVNGVSYTYKDGYITLKNNSKYDLQTLNISADYTADSDINGLAFFEDIKKGTTQKQKMNFSTFKDDKAIDYKKLKPELLSFSYLKAVRGDRRFYLRCRP